jgi:hypothetical protein
MPVGAERGAGPANVKAELKPQAAPKFIKKSKSQYESRWLFCWAEAGHLNFQQDGLEVETAILNLLDDRRSNVIFAGTGRRGLAGIG